MDLGAGHLAIIVGMGGGGGGNLTTKIAGRAGHLTNFFKCPGGVLAAGIDSHITHGLNVRIYSTSKTIPHNRFI